MSSNVPTVSNEEARALSLSIINHALTAAENTDIPKVLQLLGVGSVVSYDNGAKIAVSFVFTCNKGGR